MIVLATLLLQSGATAPPEPSVTIDPCVAVDAQEVRRLTSVELSSHRPSGVRPLEVIVDCEAAGQRLRVFDPVRGVVAERSIDLNVAEPGDRDARARELALAIAELFRQLQVDVPSADPPEAPAVAEEPLPQQRPVASEPGPWRVELGAGAAVAGYAKGEVLLGVDVTGRGRLSSWLLGELRAGVRQSRPLALEDGSMSAQGFAVAGGLSLNLAPSLRWAGLSLGVRAQVDRLRYVARDHDGERYGEAAVTAVSMCGTTTVFVSLIEPLHITLDAAVGVALHPVVIRDDGQTRSGLRGLAVSSALGLAAQF